MAVVTILWKASMNILGGTIAVTQQMNNIAVELSKPEFNGLVPAMSNYYFGPAAKENETPVAPDPIIGKAFDVGATALTGGLSGMVNGTNAIS